MSTSIEQTRSKVMSDDKNGRTHEPNLRELTSEIDGLRDLMATRFTYVEKVMDERHQLYKERAESQKVAVDDALAAVKEQTVASFQASEKAIVKAEDSQKTYNQSHNDLTRKMEAQYVMMVPQPEAKLKWDAIDKAIEGTRKDVGEARNERQEQINNLRVELMSQISDLRESRSVGTGRDEAQQSSVQLKQWNIGTIIAILAMIAVLAQTIVMQIHK